MNDIILMLFFAVQIVYIDGDVEILLMKKERWEFVKDDNKNDMVGHNFHLFKCIVLMLTSADLICRNKQKILIILMLLQKSKHCF